MPEKIFGTLGEEKLLQLLKIISRGTVQVLLIIHAPPGLGQEKLSKEARKKMYLYINWNIDQERE